MYQDYFRFNDKPFSIAPNPRYLHTSAQRREALAHLSYGSHECGGFIVLSGEVGAGTATLCRRQSDLSPAPAREVSAGTTVICHCDLAADESRVWKVGVGKTTLCRRQSDCPPVPAREVSAGTATLCRRLLEQIQRKPQSAGN